MFRSVHADLVNVFEVFLPQLLLYPNPTDPLNGEAAALLMREPEAYNAKVKGEIYCIGMLLRSCSTSFMLSAMLFYCLQLRQGACLPGRAAAPCSAMSCCRQSQIRNSLFYLLSTSCSPTACRLRQTVCKAR